MTTKHTPGPWNTHPDDWRAIIGPAGLVIADIRCPPSGTGKEDARLIAAAPELLSALQALIKACNPEPGRGICVMDDDPPIVAALAAIARATQA